MTASRTGVQVSSSEGKAQTEHLLFCINLHLALPASFLPGPRVVLCKGSPGKHGAKPSSSTPYSSTDTGGALEMGLFARIRSEIRQLASLGAWETNSRENPAGTVEDSAQNSQVPDNSNSARHPGSTQDPQLSSCLQAPPDPATGSCH